MGIAPDVILSQIIPTTITKNNMKQFDLFNLNKSSRCNSRYIAMQQLMHRVVAILVLAFVCGEVWAGDYVIFNGTYYLDGDHANKYNIGGITDFDPKTCIWTGNSGGTFKSTAGTYLYYYNGYLALLSSSGTNCTVSGTENGTTGQYIAVGNNTNKYVYLNGTTWALNSKTTSASVLFKVQTNKENETSSNPTISGDKTFSTKNESYTFSIGTAASYIQGYIDYVFYNGTHHYFKPDNETPLDTKPSLEDFDYKWSLSDNANGYVSIDSKTGKVTYDKIYPTDTQVTLTLTATSKESKKVLTATKQITFKASTVSPTAISITSASPMTVYTNSMGQAITYSLSPTTCYDNVLFESAKTSIATVDANGMVTGVSAGNTTITVKAMKYNSTEYVSATVTVNVLNKVSTPVITFNDDGKFTISCSTPGATIHYTTNGSDPTTSDATIGNGVQSANAVPDKTVVKAIAVLDGYVTSAVASAQLHINSGVSGDKVILNDLEDHNWTYYQKSDNLPSGYPTDFLSSPNPRNVKITYKGNGQLANGTAVTSVRVGIDDRNTDTFVYYKTIENNGGYKYTTIPNPFAIRPKESNTYYGFSHWKLTSITGGTITGKEVGNNINAETEITFVPNGTYTPNCTSMEVVFEAVWDVAEVKTGNTSFTNNYGVERMFRVITSDAASDITAESKACTYTSIYPNGTTDGTTNATMSNRKYRYGGFTASADSKFEYIILRNNSSVINGTGHNLTLGRGISGYNDGLCASEINGCSNSQTNSGVDNFNFSLRVESGKYEEVYFIADHYSYYSNSRNALVPKGNNNHVSVVLGNDYDRANNENNSNLDVTSGLILSNFVKYANQNQSSEILNLTCKSGTFCSEVADGRTKISGDVGMSIYLGDNFGEYLRGTRNMLVEGGNLMCIAGGTDESNDVDETNVNLRVKGGLIRGSIYGAAARLAANGHRRFVFTGGTVNGWVAGGCNGTDAENGKMTGESFIYVGGNSHVEQNSYNRYIGSSRGGNIFGAGSGIEGGTTVGQVTNSNIVVSDHSVIGSNVFGGGNYGYVNEGTNHGSNIFVLGGDVKGSVFGGSNQQQGQTVNIFMDNGLVEKGIYGGSNEKGDINKNVTIQINGGQVGTKTTSANIHGGGYGQSTVVKGNVDITLGASGSEADADGVTVYGDVYGGSALGSVNGTTAADTYHTNVTLNAGTIHGSLYGGALGSKNGVNGATEDVAANVYGPVAVKVYGGSVQTTDGTGANGSGAVYGCNNINGKPQRAVTVDIYGTNSHDVGSKATDPSDDKYAIYAVYGGGNQAAYTFGTPAVTIHNCDNSIEYVYGGGNQATVPGTKVDVYGGNIIGTVFGGGNNANVTTNGTDVNIYGGRILNVYGGNNNGGAITGSIKVNVAEPSTVACAVNIDDLYGGGNLAASNAGTITIGKCTNINRVFGGANQANVTGPINLSIVNGNIGTVFGGNNNSGTITGAITVTVNWDGTGNRSLGSVYGGGNLAEYKGNPTVNILNCTTTGSIFGGGLGVVKDADGKITKGAFVVGNPTVNIGDWDSSHHVEIGGNVFGGGDLAAVEGDPKVTVNDCYTLIKGDLYGGGNAAPVYSTNLTMWGGTVMGNVFGGGNGKDLTKNENGAQIGYKRDDTTTDEAGTGNAVAKIFGGTVGTWNGDECTAGGGIFGGSNTKGNVRGEVQLTIDQQKCADAPNACDLKVKEIYGAGNEAEFAGTGINFNLGCVSALSEIYGGAKNADLSGDVHLIISSGHFNKVFAGNNLGGNINGSIKVTIEETGCNPVIIDELYGGGNMAAYTTPEGEDEPEVEVISCTHIGQVFGGGYGKSAVVTGNPVVNINMIPGKFDPDKAMATPQVKQEQTIATGKLGTIGTVFGGGNAANVVGNTNVNIGTAEKVTLSSGDSTYKNQTFDVKGVNITGNVYGGGNAADVTGKTNVTVGR